MESLTGLTANPKRAQHSRGAAGEEIRQRILALSKDFKTSWTSLGQALYTVWNDKNYQAWGYDKFEHYAQREVGLKKELCTKLLKTYLFLEEEEPSYLKREFSETRDPRKIPGYEEVNVLRLAKQKKELNRHDYHNLRSAVFEKGKDAAAVRKDLTALIKERKVVDPEEERDQRKRDALRKIIMSLKSFQKDMEVLKLIPDEIVQEAKELMTRLESEI